MAYLYRHIRLDTLMPFYIGIGGLKTDDNYNRAYRKSQKLERWKKIVNKVGYRVDIILDNISAEHAMAKEIEFISLYGRVDKKTGILVNMTNGGESTTGYNHTQLSKEKMSLSRIGKPTSKLQKEKVGGLFKGKFGSNHNRSKCVVCLETGIEYGSMSEASRMLKISISAVSLSVKDKLPVFGMHFQIKQ